MAFDPLAGTSGSISLSNDEIAAVAHSAAERLLADLDRAETHSDGWKNVELAQLLVDHAISECINRLASTGCWGEANQLPSSVFWKTAGPVLEVGSLQLRARTKPLGYAGDHVILARMWENSSCDHPLGRLFDRYFLALAAPRAVRARLEHAASTLVASVINHAGPDYRVVSVGAGPGIEIETALSTLPRDVRNRFHITLLDLDPDALDHASQRILKLVPQQALLCRRENLYRLASNASLRTELNGTDLIICTGFFDYLRDQVAVEMLRLFWESLASGGQMLVGNFAPHNPTRAYMEWIGNWYLVYRTAGELQDLASQAGIPPDQFSVQTERTGVDLFLVADK
jgi:hypothetical protein